MPKLVCLSGMNKGEEYELSEGCNTIGRNETNTICVFDKKASRHHCQITLENGILVIEDLNSTNGLKVNNKYVEGSMPLNIGDHIRLGQTVFLVSDKTTAEQEDISASAQFRKQQKYENLLQQTAFQVTKTTALRKLKTDKDGANGFISFFQREE
jgi:pSer/pThr/pTyr-binding forkhead associated (FHA) protein